MHSYQHIAESLVRAREEHHPSPPATPQVPSLQPLYGLIQEDMTQVDALILTRIRERTPLIYDLAHHLIASGGKRIRPAVTLITAQACGYQGKAHIPLAAAVELLHTATLLHDDVVDASALRRGLPTANELFGNKASILVGDFLLSQAFQLMANTGLLIALQLLSDASAVISQGEVMQLSVQGQLSISEKTHLSILEAKTAALFSCAAELGAVLSDHANWRPALASYGKAIGLAFQLVDDALDYRGNQERLGKAVGDDFREGKITLPVLIAYQEAAQEERYFWERMMQNPSSDTEDLVQAQHYLAQHRALERTVARAEDYASEAIAALASLPPSSAKEAMITLAHFCTHRAY